MKLKLVDYGRGVGDLEELLLPLEDEFSFAGIEADYEVIKTNALSRTHWFFRFFKGFDKWARIISKQLPSDVIGLALMPYQPSNKELNLDSFIYHSSVIPTGLNYYGNIIFLNDQILTTIDLLLKVAIHELSDVISGGHYAHDGRGPPCANNGDTNFSNDECSVANTIHYLNSVSPWLCDNCRDRLRELINFYRETDKYFD